MAKETPEYLAAIQHWSHPEYGLSATHHATLTMENDSTCYHKFMELRGVDGTVSAQLVSRVFTEQDIEVPDWALGKVNFALMAEMFSEGLGEVEQPNTVLEALRRATINGNQVFLSTQMDKKDYAKVNAILEALGGKWSKGKKAHLFAERDPEEAIADFLVTGKCEMPKEQKFGYFPTQPALAEYVVSRACLKPGMQVLESSAGTGGLALPCAEIVGFENVICYELQEKHCEKLRKLGMTVTMADFLTVAPVFAVDCVVINPPFERQADIDHVLHSYRFLKPGGMLVSVMASSVKHRTNKKTVAFREFLDSVHATIVDNPSDAFRASGTMVSTVTIWFMKPLDAMGEEVHSEALPTAKADSVEAVAPVSKTDPVAAAQVAQIAFEF